MIVDDTHAIPGRKRTTRAERFARGERAEGIAADSVLIESVARFALDAAVARIRRLAFRKIGRDQVVY